MSLEERVARVEGVLSQMDKRLNHVETELAELRKAIDRSFRWTIGIMLTMWVTIILAILLK